MLNLFKQKPLSEELVQEYEAENNLPSAAPHYFRTLITAAPLGYRELDLICDWLAWFLEMTQAERDEVYRRLR